MELYTAEQKLLDELVKTTDKEHQAVLKRQITRLNKVMEKVEEKN
ncbi:hypothetical protein BN988_01582 [Oceanobacillus picturae]|uniref:Uncharacterized protein n=1 Tax=Oceanobacillus picturae TaxID=171693 RepID=W9AJM2_9BACI|nr:hypothetical protein [Oceanobacillus picturae]CDO03082.1 hypothetical protein BN988_01582 [Oceanobacillus picturae]